ncbi:MAG TPA: tyrosine-type recombinase/integrase [Candidatus Babeliales bacterium]|nr:tyrosine-type recombinase/integrase [Candidatus Babeliales bacterium]
MKIERAIDKFETHLASRQQVSSNTLQAYRADCTQLTNFLKRKKISSLKKVKPLHLKSFLGYLKRDLGLKSTSMSRKISSIKKFFNFLHKEHQVQNLGETLIFPRKERKLPKYLTEGKVFELFERAALDKSSIGQRNYMMVHLMYVTGIRVSELVKMKMSQLRLDMGLVTVLGKGSKERQVPLPEPTQILLIGYMEKVRPECLKRKKKEYSSDFLFPIIYRKEVKHVTRQAFWATIKKLCPEVSYVSPHTLRHSLATHLLHKGVDLRSLQMILGHEHLSTVEIYTHVDMSHLRSAYNKKHPRS